MSAVEKIPWSELPMTADDCTMLQYVVINDVAYSCIPKEPAK